MRVFKPTTRIRIDDVYLALISVNPDISNRIFAS